MASDIIATWIYLDSAEESSEYPQAGGKSHEVEFQKIYWRCVAVFFALSTRFNRARRHVLFTNQRPDELPVVDGLDLGDFFRQLQVEVVTLPLTYQTPAGFFGRWRNQFYIFDILSFFEKQYPDNARLLVLDSDCLINRPLDGLFADLAHHGLLVLPLAYDDVDALINGITRRQSRELYTSLDGRDPGHFPVYYGGEAFAATAAVIRQINALAPGLWHAMLERHAAGLPKLTEEAHFLSYCYYRLGKFGSLEPYIRRIWTSPQYSNVLPDDVALPIWHLPSEKKGGIALLFRNLRHNGEVLPAELPDEQVPGALGGMVGVPRRTQWFNWRQFVRYSRAYRLLRSLSD